MIGSAARALAARWRGLTLIAAYVGGWAFMTWGLARLLVIEVWLLSVGVFLLSVGGLGLLKDIALEGVVVLFGPRGRS